MGLLNWMLTHIEKNKVVLIGLLKHIYCNDQCVSGKTESKMYGKNKCGGWGFGLGYAIREF